MIIGSESWRSQFIVSIMVAILHDFLEWSVFACRFSLFFRSSASYVNLPKLFPNIFIIAGPCTSNRCIVGEILEWGYEFLMIVWVERQVFRNFSISISLVFEISANKYDRFLTCWMSIPQTSADISGFLKNILAVLPSFEFPNPGFGKSTLYNFYLK